MKHNWEGGLVWNCDLTLDSSEEATIKRKQEIEQANMKRPKITPLEKDIMLSVIGLYVIILGGFALFHYYGTIAAQEPPSASESQEVQK